MRRKNIARLALITAVILLIPLVAMQFSNEVNWTFLDFITAAALLFGTGLVYEFLVKKMRGNRQRKLATIALLAALFLIWAELAVGIFGSPFAGS